MTSILLADSLAQFSKAAYDIYTKIETQSHEATREARSECDKIARDLHAATLEVQAWKQATAEAKAALAQAELTIAHQVENIESQHQTIAELRREVTQWKDQSRNWQEHFLRVEQERCGQSSRIDELLRQQYSRPINVFTPKQKYASDTNPHAINSAPATNEVLASPSQPPSYKSAAPHSPSDAGSCSDTSLLPVKSKQTNPGTSIKRRTDMPFPNSSKEVPRSSIVVEHPNLDSSNRKTKATNSINATVSSSQQLDPQTTAAPRTTLIRRVQAVIQVKHEESDDASGEDVIVGANQRRSSRRRRMIFNDDDDIEQHYLAADGNPVLEPRRHRNVVSYQEDNEEDDDDDDDELMMGAEENHEEVYGTQRIDTLDTQRSKQQQPTKIAAAPPKKKRKLAAR